MKHLVTMAERKGCHGGETKNGATATYPKMMPRNITVLVAHGDTRLERPAAWSAQGHGDDRQQEAASGGRATTRRSCSGSCKWWTDAGSGKASGVREKESARGG
ncbi:hypothetical protein VPH35_072283 [Triticum aestivum]